MTTLKNQLLFRTVPSIKQLKTDQLHDISQMILESVLIGNAPCFTNSHSHSKILLDLYDYLDVTNSIVVIGKQTIQRTSPKIRFITIFTWSNKFECAKEMKNPRLALEVFDSEGARNFLFSNMSWIECGISLTSREVNGILETLAIANETQVWMRTNQAQVFNNFVGRSFSPIQSSTILMNQGGLIDDTHVLLFHPNPKNLSS
jgi:hypothetical protein